MSNGFHDTLTDMIFSRDDPLTATTSNPGTCGMSVIESISGFKFGETINDIRTLL